MARADPIIEESPSCSSTKSVNEVLLNNSWMIQTSTKRPRPLSHHLFFGDLRSSCTRPRLSESRDRCSDPLLGRSDTRHLGTVFRPDGVPPLAVSKVRRKEVWGLGPDPESLGRGQLGRRGRSTETGEHALPPTRETLLRVVSETCDSRRTDELKR